MHYIEIKAPAKINIGLFITSKRADGFHNLNTLFYPINDLFDLLTFEKSDSFSFECNTDSIPKDENNLVVKAKILLEKIIGNPLRVKIKLDKKIPSGAGLGGGSSDAAATLISLNELFRINLKYEQLIELALQLGSDVSFFIKSKPAIGKSRGELLEQISLDIEEPILVVNPGIHVSTKEAFMNIVPRENNFDFKSIIANEKLNYKMMRDFVQNDFEEYVFNNYTGIRDIKNIMYKNGAVFSLMSGSGSTVYGIFKDIQSAQSAKEKMPKNAFCHLSIQDR